MSRYEHPVVSSPPLAREKEIILVASGDSRPDANRTCWQAQADTEAMVIAAFATQGYTIKRGHHFDPEAGHGFISSQRMGMDVFQGIDPNARLIVVEAVWQFSHHVLAGLRSHKGPILTIANWSGQWPGLVGLLNLNGSLTKMGVEYSSLWSVNFEDEFFLIGMREWLETGTIRHDSTHVREFISGDSEETQLGKALAAQIQHEKAIFGVFDEGCMGMYNAIIDDELLNPMGIYKERLSQSALVAEMSRVPNSDAEAIYDWLLDRGVKFDLGSDPVTELTLEQVLEQCKMYVAAVRLADFYSCNAIGIQYQLGLADLVAASDLVEGLLNNPDRPPVQHAETGEELFKGKAIPHFNEVDEAAAVDAFVTNRIWTAMSMDPSTTLHDLRYGEEFNGDYVWVFLISGAAPASHFIGGYAGAQSDRQPAMYFKRGGGTLKGVSRPGEIVWSRVYVANGELHCDMGRATVVELPAEETQRRWEMTTPQWPIMHAVLHGVSRDQMMARHKANHLNVVYGESVESADRALVAKAAMLNAMGIKVHFCGV